MINESSYSIKLIVFCIFINTIKCNSTDSEKGLLATWQVILAVLGILLIICIGSLLSLRCRRWLVNKFYGHLQNEIQESAQTDKATIINMGLSE